MHVLFYFRYEIMKSCWKFMPEERPGFGELVKKIENMVDVVSKKSMLKKKSTAYLPVYS